MGGVTYHEIKMARKAPVKLFHSNEQSITSLSGGNDDAIVHLVTGPQSFYKKDGKPYKGMVSVKTCKHKPIARERGSRSNNTKRLEHGLKKNLINKITSFHLRAAKKKK